MFYHILVVCPRFARVGALDIGYLAYDIIVVFFAILMRDVLCCVLSGGVSVTVVV